MLNRSRLKTVLQEPLPTLPPPQSQDLLQSFQKPFLPQELCAPGTFFSIHCNIASALYSQPSKKKITPLGIKQKKDTWGFVGYMKGCGLYFKKM